MRRYIYLLALVPLLWCRMPAQAQAPADVLMQGFYWNVHPGDCTDLTGGGVWWDSLATVAPTLAEAGFQTVWVPAPQKSFAGVWDMGYGPRDYYDLGSFAQPDGLVRTRFGTRAQLDGLLDAAHTAGLNVMVDLVLNHRGGADLNPATGSFKQKYEFTGIDVINGGVLPDSGFTYFDPPSGRMPGDSTHFHPNLYHRTQDGDLYFPWFFEDICPFNKIDATPPEGGWYFGAPTSPGVGAFGDSLIAWGRWMLDDVGFDEVRLDAVKHIEPDYLAKFAVELVNGTQPFIVGESFDGSLANLSGYHAAVEGSANSGTKAPNFALFDFALRFALRDMANTTGGGYDLWNFNTNGLVTGTAMTGDEVVTFVENHDVDRPGYEEATAPCPITSGGCCLQIANTAGGHDPVVSDKHMPYAYIMAAEGRPMVFWKDWYWYNLADEIRWQMALRGATAGGASTSIAALNPFFGTGWHGGDLHVLNRAGGGGTSGGLLVLNDRAAGGGVGDVWVDAPFADVYLKDYSDAFPLETRQVFADTRVNVRAQSRNYAWYAPTGLYPQPPGEPTSAFTLTADVGRPLHFVVVPAAAAAALLVNGTPLQVGDQIAVKGKGGTGIAGLGRIGQGVRWDGVHDLLIEVLEGDGTAGKGLQAGDVIELVVYDASTGTTVEAGGVTYSTGAFTLTPRRPPSRPATEAHSTTATTQFLAGGISRVSGFNAQAAGSVVAAKVYMQGPFNGGQMDATLNGAGLLPLVQPYADPALDGTALDYDGVENVPAGFFAAHPEMVDWVIVEVRTAEGGPAVARRAALLKTDGTLVDTDGVNPVLFPGLAAGNYYIVIRHRSHLDVMSAAPVALSDTATLYDFSTAQTQAFGTNPMIEAAPGVFAAYGGDGNADAGVTAFDMLTVWLPQNGTVGYLMGDFNMSGGATAFDMLTVWLVANGQESQVP